MTKVQAILSEINQLDKQDIELILKTLIARLEEPDRKVERLKKYRGVGKGIWAKDAQDYINQLRREDRL